MGLDTPIHLVPLLECVSGGDVGNGHEYIDDDSFLFSFPLAARDVVVGEKV